MSQQEQRPTEQPEERRDDEHSRSPYWDIHRRIDHDIVEREPRRVFWIATILGVAIILSILLIIFVISPWLFGSYTRGPGGVILPAGTLASVTFVSRHARFPQRG